MQRNTEKSEIIEIDEDDLTLYTQWTRFAFWERVDNNWKNWVKSTTIESRICWSECVDGERRKQLRTTSSRQLRKRRIVGL